MNMLFESILAASFFWMPFRILFEFEGIGLELGLKASFVVVAGIVFVLNVAPMLWPVRAKPPHSWEEE